MTAPSKEAARAPVKRERNAEGTKRRILDAAEAEFAAKGFAGARLREIAREAEVQQALIHHYFADKEGLYREVIDRAIEGATRGSWTILEQVSGLAALVEGFVDMLLRVTSEHPNLFGILRLEAQSGTSVAIEIMRARAQPVVAAVVALLEGEQRAGRMRADIPAPQVVLSVMAMTMFPIQERKLLEAVWPFPLDDAELVARRRSIVEIVLRGALPR